jgi:hypothetical protein
MKKQKTILQIYKRKDLEYFQKLLNDSETRSDLALVFSEDQINQIRNYEYMPWYAKPLHFLFTNRKIIFKIFLILFIIWTFIMIGKGIQYRNSKDNYFQQEIQRFERTE